MDFLKWSERSEKYKELLSYLYLCDRYEFSAFLHGYQAKISISKLSDLDYSTRNLNLYKKMQNFEVNWNDFKTSEKNNILEFLTDKKYLKQLQNFIRKKGIKFIRKASKLHSYEE